MSERRDVGANARASYRVHCNLDHDDRWLLLDGLLRTHDATWSLTNNLISEQFIVNAMCVRSMRGVTLGCFALTELRWSTTTLGGYLDQERWFEKTANVYSWLRQESTGQFE